MTKWCSSKIYKKNEWNLEWEGEKHKDKNVSKHDRRKYEGATEQKVFEEVKIVTKF